MTKLFKRSCFAHFLFERGDAVSKISESLSIAVEGLEISLTKLLSASSSSKQPRQNKGSAISASCIISSNFDTLDSGPLFAHQPLLNAQTRVGTSQLWYEPRSIFQNLNSIPFPTSLFSSSFMIFANSRAIVVFQHQLVPLSNAT